MSNCPPPSAIGLPQTGARGHPRAGGLGSPDPEPPTPSPGAPDCGPITPSWRQKSPLKRLRRDLPKGASGLCPNLRAPSQHGDSPAATGTFLPGRGDGIFQGKRSDVASGQGEGQEGSVSSQFLLPLPPPAWVPGGPRLTPPRSKTSRSPAPPSPISANLRPFFLPLFSPHQPETQTSELSARAPSLELSSS